MTPAMKDRITNTSTTAPPISSRLDIAVLTYAIRLAVFAFDSADAVLDREMPGRMTEVTYARPKRRIAANLGQHAPVYPLASLRDQHSGYAGAQAVLREQDVQRWRDRGIEERGLSAGSGIIGAHFTPPPSTPIHALLS